jgi:hypothetical protein
MRKFLVISIPIVSLALFVLVMLSGHFFKSSFGKNDNIPKAIELTLQDIQSENWKSAQEDADNLSAAWKVIVKRIQFSSERDEINSFDSNLARLNGAIMAKDKSSSLMELNEAYEHWEGLGK